MKPRLDPRRLPAAAGERYRARPRRGARLARPSRGHGAVAVTVTRNRFAAGDLATAALIDQIVAQVLT
jgi:hypothetical protein